MAITEHDLAAGSSPHYAGDVEPLEALRSDSEGFFVPSPTIRHKGEAQIGGAVVHYTMEVPEEIADPIPTVIINGYGAKQFAYDGLRSAIAQRGKPAISMHPYGFKRLRDHWDPRQLIHPENILQKAVWGVMRDARYEEVKYPEVDVEQFDTVGHSMGFRVAVGVAIKHPDSVASVTNLQGVGVEKQNLSLMAKRLPAFLREELLPAFRRSDLHFERGLLHALRSELDYFALRGPMALAEGIMAATANVIPDIEYLKRQHDLGFLAIVGGRDTLISSKNTVAQAWHLFEEGSEVLDQEQHIGPIVNPHTFASTHLAGVQKLRSRDSIEPAA